MTLVSASCLRPCVISIGNQLRGQPRWLRFGGCTVNGVQEEAGGAPIGRLEQAWSDVTCDETPNRGPVFLHGPLSEVDQQPISDRKQHHSETSPEGDERDMVSLVNAVQHFLPLVEPSSVFLRRPRGSPVRPLAETSATWLPVSQRRRSPMWAAPCLQSCDHLSPVRLCV